MPSRPVAHSTPWCVVCPTHGHMCLTKEEYDLQMEDLELIGFLCPECNQESEWDEANYDAHEGDDEEDDAEEDDFDDDLGPFSLDEDEDEAV